MTTFDARTLRCVVQARLNQGEDPGTIFRELKTCKVVDISALRLVIDEISNNRSPHMDSPGLPADSPYLTTPPGGPQCSE